MTADQVKSLPTGGGKADHQRVDRWRYEAYWALYAGSPALLREVLCGG